MKEIIKAVSVIFGLFASALLLYGICTCGYFRWWMIPTGIVCSGYLIGLLLIGIARAKRGMR